MDFWGGSPEGDKRSEEGEVSGQAEKEQGEQDSDATKEEGHTFSAQRVVNGTEAAKDEQEKSSVFFNVADLPKI